MAILKNGVVISGGANDSKDITYDNSKSSIKSNVLQDAIDEIAGNVSNINTDISGLSESVSNINTDISGLSESVSNINTDISGLSDQITAIQGVTLISTLTAGQTQLVFTNDAITTDSMFDYYVDTYGVSAKNITVSNHTLTMTFDALQNDVNIKVVVR